MLVDRCILHNLQGQFIWAVIFLPSTSEGHAAGCDSPPVLLLLRSLYDKSKGTKALFTLHLIKEEMIIDQVCITWGLITAPKLTALLGVCDCQASNEQIASGGLSRDNTQNHFSSARKHSNIEERATSAR